MRISDWSSDVCSSDLLVGIIEREKPVRLRVDRAGVAGSQPIFARRKRRGGGEGYRLRRGVGRRGQGGGVAIGTGEAGAREAEVEQIGRASCRARVCQYV